MYIMGIVTSVLSLVLMFVSTFWKIDKDWKEMRDFITIFCVIWLFIISINNI